MDNKKQSTGKKKQPSRLEFLRHKHKLSRKVEKKIEMGTIPKKTDQKLKIGILGAGATGLYAAMLLKSLGQTNFEILESNSRLGGRIFTKHFEKCDDKNNPQYYNYFDVGAMRFPNTETHARVIGEESWSLKSKINALGGTQIELVDYILGSENNYQQFNGINVIKKNIKKNTDTFKFGKSNGGYVPDELTRIGSSPILSEAYDKYIQALLNDVTDGFKLLMTKDQQSTREYLIDYFRKEYGIKLLAKLKKAQKEGKPTKGLEMQITSWKKWKDDLPQIGLIIDWLETMDTGTGLYDKAFSETIMDSFEFSQEKWKAINGGTHRLVDGMVSFIGRDKIKTRCQVTKISKAENGKVKVTYRNIWRKKKTEIYDHVICTLPMGVLRNVDTLECNLSQGKTLAMRTISYDHSTKVGFGFEKRFWELETDNVIKGGQSSTDNLLRTVVYPSYGVETSPGVLIASYTWAQDASRMGAMDDFTRIKECLSNLKTIHDNVPRLKNYFAHSWTDDQHSLGAFALYGPQQFESLFSYVLKSEVGGKLHFGGEHSSIYHAWIVGALNSGYRVVRDILQTEKLRWEQIELKRKWSVPDELEVDDYFVGK